MNWIELLDENQLNTIKEESAAQPVVIFKHSTRCNISSMAKGRLERSEAPQNITFYCLDLIRFRNISNKIVEVFGVHHESPQVLMIKNGECIYDESHGSIMMDEIAEMAAAG
jgi:bacillithiol system protein YtxJ